jgi:hypothetical protein
MQATASSPRNRLTDQLADAVTLAHIFQASNQPVGDSGPRTEPVATACFDLTHQPMIREPLAILDPRAGLVELDGGQHLESVDAYRRDRRKDQLLQEHGYFVLRFLAEDVGKHLDGVLDTIQRTLFSRGQQR